MGIHKLFFSLAFFIFSFSTFAGTEKYSTRREGSDIFVGSNFEVFDGQYLTMLNNSNWSSIFTNYKVSNKVQLGINPEIIQTTDYSGSIELRVIYQIWNGSSFVSNSVDKTLSVNFDQTNPTNLIEDLSTFVLSDAHYISVEVLSIDASLNVADLFVESEIEVERYYSFDGSSISSSSWQFTSNNEFIEVFWDVKLGAEFYELEWVHIDDYTLTQGVYETQANLDYNFYKNSTRINTQNNWYRIPNVFDHGYVIYRIRPVGYQGNTFMDRYDGNWNASESGTLALLSPNLKIPVTEFDESMNWSYVASYTENGKRQEVVYYSDGLGRGRQTVSRNPATDQVIVNNSYYDLAGRLVITDLPTPQNGNDLSHRIKFNQPANSPGSEYTPFYYNTTQQVGCAEESNAFWDGSGTGQYFSSNNPNQDEANANIPDAFGFPFNRVTYLNDPSGRILRISGFGDDLKIGSGRETRFVYPSTNQTELNELFGSEIGYSGHYEKVISIDPNGQVYTQYLDMSGRVVASYMAGPSPDQMDPLPGQGGSIETVDMIDPNNTNQGFNPPSTTIIYTDYIAEDGTITVNYAFSPQQYQSVCLPANICFDCVYDLTLSVMDECGAIISNETVQINGAQFDEICNGSTFYSFQEEISVTAGEYIFEKTLTVNEDALDQYWCSYIENNTCLDPLSDAFNEYYDSNAFYDCDQQQTLEQSECDILQSIMEFDVSPGGQYALYDVIGGIYSVSDQTSIFYNNVYATYTYTDVNSNPILVWNPFTGSSMSPSALTFEHFVLLFEPSWAPSLVTQHHPEACYLEFCGSQANSDLFDEEMSREYNFGGSPNYSSGGAFAAGYLNPLNNVGSSGVTALYGAPYIPDPFFTSGNSGFQFVNDMQNLMVNYITLDNNGTPVNLSMWQYAIYLALNCTPANALTCIDSFDPELACSPNDLVWVNFRELYLEAKASFVYRAEFDYASSNGCLNDCIGSSAPGCSLYSNKIPRFTNLNVDVISNTSIQDIINNATPGVYGQQVIDQMIADACQQAAESYADQWLAQLSGCDFVGASINLTNLRNDFIALLISECDSDHPFTASSSPTPITISTGASVVSIHEILVSHFGTSNYQDNLCTPYLISEPGPYENSTEMSNSYVRPLDECACDRVYEAYELSQNSSFNLEEALVELTGISLEDADHLICECDKVSGGYNQWSLSTFSWPMYANASLALLPAVVPIELVCETNICNVTCEDISADVQNLHTEFSGVPNFETATNYDVILTNYLNIQYDYSLTLAHYNEFLSKCSATSTSPYCELNPLLTEWADIMTLVAYRGQLLNDVQNQVDLESQNIVFSESSLFNNFFAGDNYWASLSGSTLTMNFGTIQDNCSIEIAGPTGFDFASIVSFGSVIPLSNNCSGNDAFEVEITYFDCGELRTSFLTGSTSCFEVSECICDASGLLLCDGPVTFEQDPCYEPELSIMYSNAITDYEAHINLAWAEFKQEYYDQCAQAFSTEQYSYDGYKNRYQFMLYYYDQAGNLTKTIAPEGVVNLTGQNTAINSSRDAVTNSSSTGAIIPAHDYISSFEYNSYNQVVKTSSPDQDGESRFWYDYYGRIVAGQDPLQSASDKYVYFLYDIHGRKVETGIIQNGISLDLVDLEQDDLGTTFTNWLNLGSKTEVVVTQYDKPLSSQIEAKFSNGQQTFLRLRIASIMYFPTFSSSTNLATDFESAKHFSYDVHGNLIEQIQDVPMLAPVEQDIKSTQYEIELISGHANKIIYQEDEIDHITHEYFYDELNRIEEVFTTTDNIHNSREAHYFYYDYGPISRVEIGQNKVQGSDFAYTINGWQKGTNASTLNPQLDMGNDGVGGFQGGNTSIHEWIAKDVTAFTIGYFEGDYSSIGSNGMEITSQPTDAFALATENLYNGNISHLVTSIYGMSVIGSAYKYDQLNRLKEMTAFYNTNTNNTWSGMSASQEYFNAYSYDKNGNITSLQRNGTVSSGLLMDNFTYTYVGLDGLVNSSSLSRSNRLDFVDDSGANDATVLAGVGDIKSGMQSSNYEYDALGQLIKDDVEDRTYEWRLGDHKLTKISPILGSPNPSEIEFIYSPIGQRILKILKPTPTSPQEEWEYTYYSYDPSGQVAAVYNITMSSTNNLAELIEQNILGNKRHGLRTVGELLYDNGNTLPTPGDIHQNVVGLKQYECVNHLGDVQAIITDRKTWNSTDLIYEATVVMTSDYYPFGMVMPDRNWVDASAQAYRYAYNGMERDNEVSGIGNSYTTEFRQYDPRLGRWKSLDPYRFEFPWQSPYAAFDNNPIFFTDRLGLAAEWIDNGDGTYTAEDGDSAWSLFEQFLKDKGFSWKEVKDLFVNGGCAYYDETGTFHYDLHEGNIVDTNIDNPSVDSGGSNSSQNTEDQDEEEKPWFLETFLDPNLKTERANIVIPEGTRLKVTIKAGAQYDGYTWGYMRIEGTVEDKEGNSVYRKAKTSITVREFDGWTGRKGGAGFFTKMTYYIVTDRTMAGSSFARALKDDIAKINEFRFGACAHTGYITVTYEDGDTYESDWGKGTGLSGGLVDGDILLNDLYNEK